MTELRLLQHLVNRELKEANKKYPLFSSDHEAYAVIKEEIEECEEDVQKMKMGLNCFWWKIKKDRKEDDLIIGMKKLAMHAAAEAIQVAAMCDKFMMNKDTYLNGWIKCKDLSEMTPENICTFCSADPDECGEYPDICYKGIMRESK